MLSLLSSEAQAELVDLIDARVAQHLAEQAHTATHSSPWLTVAEAAEYLRTTPGAIYKRIKRGQLTSYRFDGSQLLLHRQDLALAGPLTSEVL